MLMYDGNTVQIRTFLSRINSLNYYEFASEMKFNVYKTD